MSALQLFWLASVVGSGLFLVAGALIASARIRARHSGAKDVRVDHSAELEALRSTATQQSQQLVGVADQLRRSQEESQALGDARATEQQAYEVQLQELRDRLQATQLQAQIAADRANTTESQRERLNLATATAHDEVATLKAELTALSQDNANLGRSAAEAKELRDQLRDKKVELGVLERRVNELETIRSDYLRLRTQRNEEGYLREQVARLTAEAAEPRTQRTKPVEPLVVPTSKGKVTPNSVSEALQNCLSSLVDEGTTWSIVVADAVGFPISSIGANGVALAAYSTLLAAAGTRAATFVPTAHPEKMTLLDGEGAHISLFPFTIDGETVSLVTFSGAPIDDTKARQTVRQLEELLSRSGLAASATN